jgi:ATP-dependent DNA helicase RecQ
MSTATLAVPSVISNPTRQLLQSTFGFSDFRQGQEAVISRLLGGKSVLSIFPTGAGKSLCYQLPALLLDGVTLVISPLIALMKDQIDFLQEKGVPAARLDSTLEFTQTRQITSDLLAGRLKLLYIAPERLANERFLRTLRRLKIAMLAIDEAHCISEWGHNFRPDYMKLAQLARDLNVGRVLALTATATPAVARDIARSFNIAPEDVVKTPFHRPNLALKMTQIAPPQGETPSEPQFAARNELLLNRIRSRPSGPTIVYVTLQKTADEVAAFLSKNGLDARPYYAGLDPETRHQVQDWFMASDRAIVVATIAFGMGIDKSDIRYVYHYNLPKSLENYAQEIGRAGRDGKPSTCELIASPDDRIPLENFTYGDTPTARSIHALLTSILSACPGRAQRVEGDDGQFDISIYDLSGEFDIRPLVIETILTYLELEGIISSTGPFYGEYKFQPLRPSAEILADFDPQRKTFLKTLFQCGQRGVAWWNLDLRQAMHATGATRQRIVAALNYLEEHGHLKLQAAGARQGYRLLRQDVDLQGLCKRLAERFLDRERKDVERLDRVVEFAGQRGCRTAFLLNYFGESLGSKSAKFAKCNHCDVCEDLKTAAPVPPLPARELSPKEFEQIRQLRALKHPALATPRQLARFLCGINSPATARAKFANGGGKLRDDPRFGMLTDVPFATVLKSLTPASRPS